MSESDKEIVDRVRAGADFTKSWMSRRSDVLQSNISENRSILGKVKEFVTGKPSLTVDEVIRVADVPIVKPPEDMPKSKATVGGETVVKGGVPVEIRVYPQAIRNADTNGILRNFRGEYAETTGSHEQGHTFDAAAKNAMSKHILKYLRKHKLLSRVMDGFSGTKYKTPEDVAKEIYAGLMEARRKRQANPEVPAVKRDYEAISVLPEALINSRLSPEDLVNIDNATASHSTSGKYGTMAASKGGNTRGEPKSSGVPRGHNAALDGYSGPRIVINPSVFKDEKDALCVAFDEAFRVVQELNGFDPVAEPTEKQRRFFAETAYANDERMLRRTILARICTFDTSVTDPTDEQLEEAVEFLDTVMEIGAPQNQWEQRAVERIRTAIEKSIGQPRAEEPAPEPPAEGPAVAAAGGGETEEEAMKRLAAGDTGKTLQEDTSTLEEREQFLEERGMDKSLAETGSMGTLVKMHEQQNGVYPADAARAHADQTPAAPGSEAQPKLTNADVLASRDAVEFVAANGGGTTGNGIAVDAGARVMDDGRIVGADGNARNADGKIDNFGRNEDLMAEMQQADRQQQQADRQRQTASERIGVTSGVTGIGGRELTAGEAAWQARRQASTAAWMQRTGRGGGDAVADVLARQDEEANNLRQTASERIGVTSGVTGIGGRELTAGEAAWQARRQASTEAWHKRTGRDESVFA